MCHKNAPLVFLRRLTEVDQFNPLMGTLKWHSSTVIGTLAIDGWAVTFGTARRGLSGLRSRPVPPRCTKCNSPPINAQYTNVILFHVAL